MKAKFKLNPDGSMIITKGSVEIVLAKRDIPNLEEELSKLSLTASQMGLSKDFYQ